MIPWPVMPGTASPAESGSASPLRGPCTSRRPSSFLDEATAYADPENEALIQQAISKLVAGKSLIVVAHRLNTIRNADQILVVANGEIVGRGIQEELLENCPLYRKMWQDYAGSTEGGVEDV